MITPFGWVCIGLVILLVFGWKGLASWLTPGMLPPGPIG